MFLSRKRPSVPNVLARIVAGLVHIGKLLVEFFFFESLWVYGLSRISLEKKGREQHFPSMD